MPNAGGEVNEHGDLFPTSDERTSTAKRLAQKPTLRHERSSSDSEGSEPDEDAPKIRRVPFRERKIPTKYADYECNGYGRMRPFIKAPKGGTTGPEYEEDAQAFFTPLASPDSPTSSQTIIPETPETSRPPNVPEGWGMQTLSTPPRVRIPQTEREISLTAHGNREFKTGECSEVNWL